MSEACDASAGIMLISYCGDGSSVISKINKVESLLVKKMKEINSIHIASLPKDSVPEEPIVIPFACSLTIADPVEQIACVVAKSDVTQDVLDAIELLEQEYCSLEEEFKQLKDYVCED